MMTELSQPVYLTVPEAAKLCGVSRNTLFTWVRKGKLSAYQTPGRTNLIRPSDLVLFMQSSGLFIPDSLNEMAQRDAAENTGPAKSAAVSQTSILVVDDDPATRSVMVRALNKTHMMYQAQTGYEALHLLTIHPEINMVLLDLQMPGQHGLETLKEIKTLRPDAQVIIVTGFAHDIPNHLVQSGRIARILEKPVTVPALIRAVDELSEK
jgi:excisionase family DNA binding protein